MDIRALEAFSDDRRRAIIEVLADGERCVCDVSNALGISTALASHHLKRLRETGVVVTRRQGAWLHCRLDADVLLSLSRELSDLATRSRNAPSGCCAVPPVEKGTSDE